MHFMDLSTIIYGCIIVYHSPTGKGLAEEMRYFFVHYLDNAATTPVPEEVIAAMADTLRHHSGNPSSQYPYGQDGKAVAENGREIIARALGCPKERLFFTSCGTESDAWAIRGAVWHGRHKGRHIVTTAVEHSAVLESCRWLESEGYQVTYLKPDSTGMVSAQQVLDAVREDTVLVSMMLVNNETGCVFPVAEAAKLLREAGSGALLHCDAVQGFLKVPCDPVGWGVDLMGLSAHKLGGPKGIGALYISPKLRNFRPLLPGGGQEMGLRSGTEATAQIAGFAKAVELRLEHYDEKIQHMADMKALCREKLLTIAGMVTVGGGTAPHILAMSLPGYPSGNIVSDLGSRGICISAGSACHKGKSSHVVSALGLDKRTAAGVIRISFAPETTEDDIQALYEALKAHRAERCGML